jgi:hypothetical protein
MFFAFIKACDADTPASRTENGYRRPFAARQRTGRPPVTATRAPEM